MKFFSTAIVSLVFAGCVTTLGWKQEGKTEQDMKRDNGECKAQANQESPDHNPFTVNRAYGECMEGRGWSKD